MNQTESVDGKWFHRMFVKGCITGLAAWNLGWRMRETVNVYRGR